MTATATSYINGKFTVPTGNPLRKTRRRWIVGLFGSMFFGSACGLGGFVVGVLSLVGFVTSGTSLSTLSAFLIAASFPSFVLAAHCLDKVDAADRRFRLDYCRKHGLSGAMHVAPLDT